MDVNWIAVASASGRPSRRGVSRNTIGKEMKTAPDMVAPLAGA